MDLLEFYYENIPMNENYIDRKVKLYEAEFLNIYGARGSGKSTIVLDYIHQSDKNILYIDLEDPKLLLETYDTLPINLFIKEYDIDEVVLDHYENGLLDEFPKVDRLIIISRLSIEDDNFIKQRVYPLDYEEFLGFEYHKNESTAFNHFLKIGTLPISAIYQKSFTQNMKISFQNQFNEQEQAILLILAKYHTKALTTHQIYNYTKEYFKISKDYVYQTIKLLQEEGVVYFIDNHIKRSGKKVIIYDFALAKYISTKQLFTTNFEALTVMSLIKDNIEFKAFGIYGYITQQNELIITAPFESENSIWLKAQERYSIYKKYQIRKVTIITINNSFEFHIENLHFEAIPYTEWAIIDNNEIY
jgi:hypothetical protein